MHDCLIDGEISNQLPVTDRGFLYGHGVFETIACETGEPVFWPLHLERLFEGCQRLGLKLPDENVLLSDLQTVCAGKPLSVVRICITAIASQRGYAITKPVDIRRIISCHPWPADVELPRLKGISIPIAEYRLAHNRALAAIKHCNRLEQVLASSEPAVQAAGEAILLDHDSFVISALSANLFLVFGEQLITPRLDRCGVHGVTRAAILKNFGHRCEKRRVTKELLNEADELFICNSVRGIWPLTGVGEQKFNIGPVTRELQDWLAQQSRLLARPA